LDVPDVWFYIPHSWWPSKLPSSPATYWAWVLEEAAAGGHIERYTGARHASTLRTYLQLREAGFACELTDVPAHEGIVITHTDFLPHTGADTDAPWKRRGRLAPWMLSTFVVCFQADRSRHPYAQIHVVQNREDAASGSSSRINRLARGQLRYVPLWTQPGLLPRDDSRGDRFTNVAFFGIADELDPQLLDDAWHDRLRERGFEFTVRPSDRWHDYRDVDAVVAARSFTYPGKWLLKPPSKLFNAWLAGIPAVLGRESAYQAERRTELDYIEVSSRADVELALLRLRDEPNLRKAMVENGRRRATEVAPAAVTEQWRRLIEDDATPAYEAWKALSPASRVSSALRRAAFVKLDARAGPLLDSRRVFRELNRHRSDWR
jgi:hypothetical protein